MGCFGSGERWGHKKPAVEDCWSLDTTRLRRWGLLVPGSRAGTIAWRRGDDPDPKSTVGYVLEVSEGAGSLRLNYRVVASGEPCAYTVRLVTTPCHFGGVRWWFVCPLGREGVWCRRRVRKLYLRGSYFGCRQCHGLTYLSTQQSDKRVYAALRSGFGLGRLADPAALSVPDLVLAMKVLAHERRKLDKIRDRIGDD